jgi:nucleolar pre-ribosomal-associated protein 2
VLHYYCTRVLSSTPAEGLRDALTQGLWSMIEAIEINNADGIKSLSSAMTNSEREILRSIYEDWKRFGKWRGG